MPKRRGGQTVDNPFDDLGHGEWSFMTTAVPGSWPRLAFRLLPEGFANREFREHVGRLLADGDYGSNRATYDLGRLRMRGLIKRIPHTRRYQVTGRGHRVALCYCRTHRRILGPVLATVADDRSPPGLGRLVER